MRLNDYVTYTTTAENTHHDSRSSSSKSSRAVQGISQYPLSQFISDSDFSPGHLAYMAAVAAGVEPKHFKEAIGQEVWDDAMYVEVDALEELDTWDIVDLPPGKEAIDSQWVYKIKYNPDGTIRRYKARIVGNGRKQVAGKEYNDTFAPVVKRTTIRSLLRIAASKK